MSQQRIKDVREAENFLQFFHKPGLGYTNCVLEYNKESTVKGYKDSSTVLSYESPGFIANMLAGLITDMENAKILDLCAGTGYVGEALHKRGFRNLDAHDGAQAMVDHCKKTGVYQNFFKCFVGDGNTLPMKDNTYDGIGCSGATVENHLPSSAQIEIARVIKHGGFFVNSYRANLYETEVEYATEWRELAEKLEKEGTWMLYGRFFFRKYNKMSQGQMDVYQKL
ncbi:Williams-Beuren syndrome chromosomal region 27 protein [Plakobranchus ocellatus]|uniref:Williams-Beuren syndrome chromosomal region 27 protein n=1 Tax=Plakobranchus ocellatus TaxID=259542 RepID=A0AAV4B409_9GAST|nr:Williams-Beuren syndrome chromosomal region 27 protein [Plakobranchus ocellatus]